VNVQTGGARSYDRGLNSW